MDNLLAKVEKTKPEYLDDLNWLQEQKESGAFISVQDYRKKVLGDKADQTNLKMNLQSPWRSAPASISPGCG